MIPNTISIEKPMKIFECTALSDNDIAYNNFSTLLLVVAFSMADTKTEFGTLNLL